MCIRGGFKSKTTYDVRSEKRTVEKPSSPVREKKPVIQ